MRTMRLSTSCVFLLTLTVILNDAMKFTLKKGQRVSSGATQIKHFTENGMTLLRCAALCSINACGSFHLSQTENVCELFSEFLYIYKHGVELTTDPQWMMGYSVLVTGGDWVLAFRAVKANNVSVFNTWTNSNLQHDNPVSDSFPLACLRLANTGSCDRHFRSQILNNWTNIKEVRFSMVKSDTEVAYAQFNGTDTSRDSWFTPDRILSSTWSPGVLRDNLFNPTIQGICDTTGIRRYCRRFSLHVLGGSCSDDWLYTVTLDSAEEVCIAEGGWPHAGDMRTFPMFYYSATSERSSLANNSEYSLSRSADALAVWVKFT